MDLLLIHLVLLTWLSAGTAIRLLSTPRDRLSATAILLWSNLAAASAISRLSGLTTSTASTAGTSLALAATLHLLARRCRPAETPDSQPSADPMGVAVVIMALASLAACSSLVLHAYGALQPDPASPLRTSLANTYEGSVSLLNYTPVAGWLLLGVAVTQLARQCGASAGAALAACFIILVAPPVLAQATAPDSPLALLALLAAGIAFLLRWTAGRLRRDAMLAVAALTLAAIILPRLPDWLAPDAPPAPFLAPLFARPAPLAVLDENHVSFGWEMLAGLALLALFLPQWKSAHRPVRILAGLGFALLLGAQLWQFFRSTGVRVSLPGFLLLAPALALGFDGIGSLARPARRAMLAALACCSALSLWAGHIYLIGNGARPMAPLLDPSLARPTRQTAERETAPAISLTAPDTRRIFGADLVAEGNPAAVTIDAALLPAEGPHPYWQVPRIRWAQAEAIVLRVHAPPGTASLRLTLSARPYLRTRAALGISGNGRELRRIEFGDPFKWQEAQIEFPAQPGENRVELHDLPLAATPDWAEYLDRYQDVRRYVERRRQIPEQGAWEHYTYSGKAEGRTVRLLAAPRPAPDAHRFMFRFLAVEALRP